MGTTTVTPRGEITQEVIQTLIDLMMDVIGQKTVEIILSRFPANEIPPGKELVFAFSEATEKLLGPKGAYAVLRQVGRELAKKVSATLEPDEWKPALEQSLNSFGFADRIECESGHANICNCVFYSTLESRGLEPTAHPVCWAGWGFIEGFMKLIEGTRGIQWVRRDLQRNACEFNYLK